MKLNRYAILIFSLISASVFADAQMTPGQPTTITGQTAGGGTQTTIVDTGGSLKMVDQPKMQNKVGPGQMMVTPAGGGPVTSTGMKQSGPQGLQGSQMQNPQGMQGTQNQPPANINNEMTPPTPGSGPQLSNGANAPQNPAQNPIQGQPVAPNAGAANSTPQLPQGAPMPPPGAAQAPTPMPPSEMQPQGNSGPSSMPVQPPMPPANVK